VLQDAVSDINTKVNDALADARKSSGGRSPRLEEAVYKLLGKPNRIPFHMAPIEDWAAALPEAKDKVPGKVYQPLDSDSQYKDNSVWGGLAKVMQVAGIYIGVDKLGHFLQLGYNEYYLRTLGPGALSTDDAATEGDKTEEGIYGLLTTGVYSNADIAANRAGLKFYQDLAAAPNMAFDIRKYISAQWNEQSNQNFYGGGHWDLMAKSVEGSWTGTFTWTDGSTTRTAICNAKLDVSTDIRIVSLAEVQDHVKSVTGTYQYSHPLASFTSGELKGKIRSHMTKAGAVDLVTLEVDWTEGKATGKGTLTMRSPTQMDGKWGRLASADNGGTWAFRKV
jgi:hypothetical protein